MHEPRNLAAGVRHIYTNQERPGENAISVKGSVSLMNPRTSRDGILETGGGEGPPVLVKSRHLHPGYRSLDAGIARQLGKEFILHRINRQPFDVFPAAELIYHDSLDTRHCPVTSNGVGPGRAILG